MIRGEDGLSDWYCKAPRVATWDFVDEAELGHFEEMLHWQHRLGEQFDMPQIQGLDAEEDARLKALDVQVMVHFRAGAEPPEF